jgi:hypothetical protein
VIPELPVRRVAPQRRAPRVRNSASTHSPTRPKRTTAVQLALVGIVDLVLIVAMFHPAIVCSIFTSMPMTITVLSATATTAPSWGGA